MLNLDLHPSCELYLRFTYSGCTLQYFSSAYFGGGVSIYLMTHDTGSVYNFADGYENFSYLYYNSLHN